MTDRDLYYMDNINRLEAVLSEFDLPDKVTINDVTLREANQVISLSMEEKVEIARALDDLGVHQIQVGIPGVSAVDKATVEQLKKDRLQARLEVVSFAYLADWKKDLNACIDTGADSIDIFYPVSSDKRRAKGVTRAQMIETCVAAIEHAKAHSDAHITFCPFPAVRTDLEEFGEIMRLGVQAGADMILVTDTYGTSSPAAMRYFIKQLKKLSDIPLGIHCHNDLGLALANTLAAVEGGAEMVDASINGLGDRTGNCCLDEVIIGLAAFYDFDLGIETQKLHALSRLMERISGIRLAFGKGIVGDNAFVHRHDDDVRSSLEMPSSTVPIEPGLVGNKRRFVLGGEYTGPITVKACANALGVHLADEQVGPVLQAVRTRLQGRKTPLTDEEFLSIVDGIA